MLVEELDAGDGLLAGDADDPSADDLISAKGTRAGLPRRSLLLRGSELRLNRVESGVGSSADVATGKRDAKLLAGRAGLPRKTRLLGKPGLSGLLRESGRTGLERVPWRARLSGLLRKTRLAGHAGLERIRRLIWDSGLTRLAISARLLGISILTGRPRLT